MKRFNLTESVKGLIKGYSDESGTQYFILSMVNEFNHRCDDSWFQALFLEYFGDSCNINRVGNGITMVTSDMAGIALTFADSDLGLYITYMETLC